jgi:hypothetical protein
MSNAALIKEIKKAVEEAIENEDDVYIAADKAQEALDELVSAKRRKGVHFRAQAGPGVRNDHLPVSLEKVKVEVQL